MPVPRISVIVPLYNKARYIERCLGAIAAQTFTDFEAIVVNDGSTDGGEGIAGRFPDGRVRVISQPNAGPGAARNHGARLAQADLLAFLDADDAWRADYLRESADWMQRAGNHVASVTWGMMLEPRGRSTEAMWKERGIPHGEFMATPETDPAIVIAMLANMLPSSTVVRRNVFEELGGYYAKTRCLYSEDAYLYLQMLLRHAAVFDHRPMTIRYEDASELALNLKGARPVEPFLFDPRDLERDCPQPMRNLLGQVLTRRALKTASVYGYWGDHGKARELVRRFVRASDWRLPYFVTAMAGCTPLGGWLGWLARASRLREHKP